MSKQRVALTLSYDGSSFHGWQKQAAIPNTIQQHVEAALSSVADEPIDVTCAGRTDKGVHAAAQVVHFDTHAVRETHAWMLGANANLPDSIRVHDACFVSSDFHARFDAVERSYEYVIINHPIKPALYKDFLSHFPVALDADRMHVAAQHLLGEHDFSSFRAADCQSKSPVRTLHDISVRRSGDTVVINLRANAFLHHMVRNVVGTLALVGQGKQPADWVASVLKCCDRTQAGPTAPPQGLVFKSVQYPEAKRFVARARPIPCFS